MQRKGVRSVVRLASLVPLMLLLVACSATGGPPTPDPKAGAIPAPTGGSPAMLAIPASSELALGPNRFLFALVDADNKPLAAPDVPVHLLFYDEEVSKDSVAFEADSRFLWAVEDVTGLYAVDVAFPSAGRWGTRFNATFPDGTTKSAWLDYYVLVQPHTPAIGAQAPSVDTPTAADVAGDLTQLSTDKSPEPRFYQTSIADALAAREPFVVAFATPGFCRSATCGPTLEVVKSVAKNYPDLTFINVEPYVMAMKDGTLQPVPDANGQLQSAPWTDAWGLLSEPFVAVVDATGAVRAKFEGSLAPEELKAAIEAL
jgi:hypothetical protein